MASRVITQPVGVAMKLSTIAKIHKYKGFHEVHHFISMAMEVHSAFGHDIYCFIREYANLFHNRQSKDHLSFFFAFNVSSIVLVLPFNVF